MYLFLSVILILGLLLVSEIMWRERGVKAEVSRKFVHITVGSFVAFWPYFLSPFEIKLLSVAFIAVVVLSKYLHIFKAIHSVQRPTLGELWFALVVGMLAFLQHHPHIYTAALLEMSLADGLAAVIGTRYGKVHQYMVFGGRKSLVGTMTFFVVSCLILSAYSAFCAPLSPLIIFSISIGATALENLAIRGLDNLVVPLFVATALLFLS